MDNRNENKDKGFSYTYSAKEQDELKKIRQKYMPPEEDKMEYLRKLDSGVSQKANTVAIIVGIIGLLILGLGMSLSMTELGEILGSHRELAVLIGGIIGVIGIVCLSLAYPIYQRVVKKERERIAPEIIRLTDELLK